ncbi:uncharacterized protein [Haliotis cracherodii]|uniref:uncharacterized protein n=1 Tax=Haliotis cracherodii TaxID=6455 RepID=UPI0039E948A1
MSGITADSFISDSTDFCSKLKNITDPDQIISYDVVDLFTNIPIDDTLQVLLRRITETPLETSLSTESIIAHTTACISSTYFEQQALTTSPIQPICCPTNRIEISVYRKPTHTDQYIHFNSNHPLRTKAGIKSTLTKQAINLSTADPKPEIEHVRQVFIDLNNYPPNLVDKVIASVLHPTPRPATLKPESAPFRIALPFIGKASNIISRLLKQQANIDTHITSSNSLNTLLRANGSNTTKPQEPKGVVYKIDCNCGQSYVGETFRPINTRMKEHKTSTIKSNSTSAISDHISNCPNHNINWDNSLVHDCVSNKGGMCYALLNLVDFPKAFDSV